MSTTQNMTVPQKEVGKAYVYFVAFVAAVGGFLFGYDLVIISGAQLPLKEYFHLNALQFGFANSSAILGCIAGPALSAFLCDRLGRKTTLFLAAFFLAVNAIWTALPQDIVTFYIFRAVGGLGVGLASLASPMYIAELAPARSRGKLGLMYQLAITVGCLSATIIAYLIAKNITDISINWRWMFGSELLPIALFVLLLIGVPQSPRWLAEKNRDKEALDVLMRVNSPEDARKEMDEIKASLNQETGTWAELFTPAVKAALFVGVMLGIFNNWTGLSGIAYYFPTLFQRAGYVTTSSAIGASLIPMIANIPLTLVAIWFVDRAGRRPLWLVTSVAMCLMLTLMGWVFQSNMQGPIVIFMTLLIIAPHAIGLGPLPWLMMSELYPTRIRARALSISTTFLWIAGFTGPFAFPSIQKLSEDVIGSPAGVFWLYAVICIFAFLFGLKYLPETKGRTLEEIAKSLEKKSKTVSETAADVAEVGK